jgi:hypothetical protein
MKGLGLPVRKIAKESFCVTGSQGGLDSLVERVFFFFRGLASLYLQYYP